jgi:hypothetical protein
MANTRRTPDEHLKQAASSLINSEGVRGAARLTGLHASTVKRIAAGEHVDAHSLVKLRAKTKTAEDYRQISPAVRDPKRKKPNVAWPLDKVRAARDAQLAGNFEVAAPLAQAMLLDDAIFVAAHNRVAPISSLGVELTSAGGIVGDKYRDRATDSVTIPRGTLVSLALTKAFHGIAFGYLMHAVDDEGTQTDMTLSEWPIEHVKWDDTLRAFTTKVDGGGPAEVITHGDGRWVIFANFDLDPFKREACLLPAALIFAAHVDAGRDWSAASRSHGQAKIVGELPEGVPLQDGDEGTLSPEAQYFLDMLADLTSGDAGAGLRPAGSKTDFLANGSSAWQVFSELRINLEKAAARVFLGNDGTLGSVGGAPGVDIATLFGVAMTKVQGDVNALESAIYSGVLVPWTAINFGDSKKAPRLKFNMPDADKAQDREQKTASDTAFFDAVDRLKASGLLITQDVLDALADRYGAPRFSLAPAPTATDQNPNKPVEPATVTKLSQPREQDGKFGNVPGAGDDAPEESDESADILPGKLKSAKARVGKARDADRKRVDGSKARLADAKSERKSIAKEAAGVDKAIDKELGPEKVKALDELEVIGSKSQRIGKHIDDAEAGKRAVSPEGAAVAANLPAAKRQKAELDARAGELKAVVGEPSPRALELRERQSRLQLEADDLDNEIEKHSGIIKGAAKREKAFDALDAALDSGDRAAIAKAQERAADLIGDSDESALDSEEFAGLAPDGDLFGDD